MIPENFIEQWRLSAPWQSLEMVEQDLVISRALVNLYNNVKVAESLAFRGGTALNKIYISPAARYSEDSDLVQIKPEPIGETHKAVRDALDSWLGEPKSKVTNRGIKLIYRYFSLNNLPAKLKVEINTTEHFHIKPLTTFNYTVNSDWFEGEADILTYQLDELMATKLSALYQRSKGRDLFDLWLVKKHKLIDLPNVLSIFTAYCQKTNSHITRAMFEQGLFQKRSRSDFKYDIEPLLKPDLQWNFEEAFQMVEQEIIGYLPGEPWKGKKTL